MINPIGQLHILALSENVPNYEKHLLLKHVYYMTVWKNPPPKIGKLPLTIPAMSWQMCATSIYAKNYSIHTAGRKTLRIFGNTRQGTNHSIKKNKSLQ